MELQEVDKVLQIARETIPNYAINTMYHHDQESTLDSWRIVSDNKGTSMEYAYSSETVHYSLYAHDHKYIFI